MNTKDRLMQEIGLSDEAFKSISEALNGVAAKTGKIPYDVFLSTIKELGYTLADSKKIMGILYAQDAFIESFASWDYKPFDLVKYIENIDKEKE